MDYIKSMVRYYVISVQTKTRKHTFYIVWQKTLSKIGKDNMCTGRQYVHRFMDKLDINHRAETGGGATEGRMYELSVFVYKTISKFDRQHDLPFHNYTSNLNTDLNDFWQRSRDVFHQQDGVWYLNSAVGKITLTSWRTFLNIKENLSLQYKKRSIRATSITVLDVGGISGCLIMKVSAHKSESLKSYSHFVSDQKKREVSDTLSSAFGH